MEESEEKQHHGNVTPITGLYENWFLDYASYVILDRAVPHINDGLKPVQRRIMHSLKEMDDGRFNKAANVIGNTMKYHPHGDASIGDAMVQLGQKTLLIDTQGNWGNPLTGDSAAAPRYIEARLSKLANEIVFNPDTTEWQSSYDGRNDEPVTLPVKFPLLLAQGVEGIAVGLSTKILPHNFIELIDASIAHLKGEDFTILPDFLTGGQADFSKYNEGLRGGKVRVRAKIKEIDKKTLAITEVPFSTTTGSLIESIVSANDKGKIKLRKIEDNTAKSVEIVLHLAAGISPDVTIDALYAFTDCEVSISPNACVIQNDKPRFLSVKEILRHNTQYTKELLKRELEIRLHELGESWHFSSLEKIFIEERIYRDLEVAESEEQAIDIIDKRLEPFKPLLKREVTAEDILKLMEIRIKRITKYDKKKADEALKSLEEEMKAVRHDLKHLTDYAIAWYQKLKDKYGKGRERKTEIRLFDEIEARQVALANVKLYMNRADGFIGTGLKKDEFVSDCSDIDDIIVFRGDGKFIVTKISEKTFVGKDILHAAVFFKNDERTVYNLIYRDGPTGTAYIKRFSIGGVTRDKEYDLTKGGKNSEVLYFTANPNGEAEVINIQLKPHQKLRKLTWDIDFAELEIKGRGSQGNIVTKYPVKKINLKSKGVSTLAGRKIWYDEVLKRLNAEGRGKYLGEFSGEDKIIALYQSGQYEMTGFDLANHYDDDLLLIEKFVAEKVYSVVHWEGKAKQQYVKRFVAEPVTAGKKNSFISDTPGSKLLILTAEKDPVVQLNVLKGKTRIPSEETAALAELIDVKGYKALGNRLSQHEVSSLKLLVPVKKEEPVVEEVELEITNEEEVPQHPEVDLEITNPGDVEVKGGDEDGQLGLF